MNSVGGRRLAALIAILLASAWLVSLGIHSKTGVSSVDQSVWQFFVNHGSSQVHSIARFVTSFGVLGVQLPVAVVVGVLVWVRSCSVTAAIAPWLSVVVCGQIVSVFEEVNRYSSTTRGVSSSADS